MANDILPPGGAANLEQSTWHRVVALCAYKSMGALDEYEGMLSDLVILARTDPSPNGRAFRRFMGALGLCRTRFIHADKPGWRLRKGRGVAR